MNLDYVECLGFRMSGNSWGRKGSRYGPRAGEWAQGGMCRVRLSVMLASMTLRSKRGMAVV